MIDLKSLNLSEERKVLKEVSEEEANLIDLEFYKNKDNDVAIQIYFPSSEIDMLKNDKEEKYKIKTLGNLNATISDKNIMNIANHISSILGEEPIKVIRVVSNCIYSK